MSLSTAPVQVPSTEGGAAGAARTRRADLARTPAVVWARQHWQTVLAGAALLLLAAIDFARSHGGAIAPFYVAPVLVALWSQNPKHAIVMAYGATALIVVGFMRSPLGHQTDFETLQRLLALALTWLAAALSLQRLGRTRRLEKSFREMEQRVQDRTAELTKSNAILQTEIADRQDMEATLRQLSTHLMHAQDQERRRIARELHDNSGQTLAAIAVNLSRLENQMAEAPAKLQNLLADTAAMAEETSRDIRTLSYLLHPPLLEEAGLAAAVEWFARGVTQRSGIQCTVEVPEVFERLPDDVEMTLFRIVQESLTNISRHSGSLVARIALARNPGEVVLKVEDEGRGIPPEKLERVHGNVSGLGVGVAGIWERVKQLKGEMEIHSNSRGTNLMVVLPLPLPEHEL